MKCALPAALPLGVLWRVSTAVVTLEALAEPMPLFERYKERVLMYAVTVVASSARRFGKRPLTDDVTDTA